MYTGRETSMLQITPWERALLELLATGTPVGQIAGRLEMPEREVELRLMDLFTRMGASNHIDAVAAAVRRGLLRA
jgi:DNA-binding NarL/FixJ family response regulator